MCASKEDVLYARRRMRFTGEPTGQAAPRHAAQIAELLYRGALDAGCVRCVEGEGDLPAFEYGGVVGGGDGGQVDYFGVSLAFLRGCSEPWIMSRESILPRRVSELNI